MSIRRSVRPARASDRGWPLSHLPGLGALLPRRSRIGSPEATRSLTGAIRRSASLLAAASLVVALSGPLVPSVLAAGPTLSAHALLQGHVRVGAWMAIEATLSNDGAAVVGELRLSAGTQGRTRFGTAVDLPTNSRKTYTLYVQPPAFGQSIDVSLVSGDRVIAHANVPFTVHDNTQLLVGIVAEKPEAIAAGIHLLPSPNTNVGAAIVSLGQADLPERVEAWAALDRIVWQDLDTSVLTPAQLAGLRGWLAAGGRLVIVGGTAGPRVLAGLPDDLLPYRPTATIDVPPTALTGLVGEQPTDAVDVPGLAGALVHGRSLAAVGDRVVAAEMSVGAGSVAILGVDPTVGWIGRTSAADHAWRRFLPARSGSAAPALTDDSQLVSALTNLPSLALPPVGGLILLLVGYIVLIGPVNYLLLRRRDRREWAWVTMPVLIAVFAAGSYGFGAAVRGTESIVNEIAVVRGAPDSTDGLGQIYVGIFSPARATYQVSIPGGALLSAPISIDQFGGTDAGSALDILQGDPARVRDLAVSFASMRAIRAETPVAVPRVTADLRLENGKLVGTLRNLSERTLERPAIVLGSTASVLRDLAPGAEAPVTMSLTGVAFGQTLSDQILGQVFFGDQGRPTDSTMSLVVRHNMVDQLTFDPMFGNTGQLLVDGPVLLAWSADPLLDVQVEGTSARRLGNTLYEIPLTMTIHGTTTFRPDLMRASTLEVSAPFFNKDPYTINFGQGTATFAYRPIAFDGTLAATRLILGINTQGTLFTGGTPVEPLGPVSKLPDTKADLASQIDGMPVIELFDLTLGDWVRLPHLTSGSSNQIANAARYVDPSSGTVLIRMRTDRAEGVGLQFAVQLEGTIE